MKDFFKPEDFLKGINHTLTIGAGNDGKYVSLSNILSIANEKLNKLIESWPVVYGFADKHGWFKPDTEANENATHKARLAFIEEFKKECVNHTPSWNRLKTIMSVDRFDNRFANLESVCMDCGVELQATWSEKK